LTIGLASTALGFPNALTPFVTSGAVEHAYDQLMSVILGGAMGDGKRLPTESQLVDQLQVSRPTVREALRMLGQAGMVERRRGRYGGWYVARRQPDRIADSMTVMLLLKQISFRELFEARSVLEATAVALAAHHHSAHDLALMREAIEQSEAAPDDLEVFARTNGLFHLALVHASQNGVLTIMMNSIQPLVDRSLHEITLGAEGIARANLAHRKILAAIADGDANGAREAVIEHLGAFRQRIEASKGNLDQVTVPASVALPKYAGKAERKRSKQGEAGGDT
jgi:GntR family transcriptional regulator, transcriptional repressor for pyruvate dehydrogenase complex